MEIFDEVLNWLIDIVPLVVSMFTLYILYRKLKPEVVKIESEANSENASAVESYAKATQIYSDELARVNEQIRILIAKGEQKDKIIMEQTITISEVTDWAERLVYQVRSMGAVPVPFKAQLNNDVIKPAKIPSDK